MSGDQEAENPISAVVTAVRSLSYLVNMTTASIHSLTGLVEDRLQCLESAIAEEKQRNRSGMPERAVNDENNLREMHQKSDERDFEEWCHYSDALIAIKYNSKAIKNLKITYSVASNLEEAVDPKISVHTHLESSDSDSKWANIPTEVKHLLLGDQIVLDRQKSMNSDQLHEKCLNHASEGETDKVGAITEIMNKKERCDPTDAKSTEHYSAERGDKPAGIPAAKNDGVKLTWEQIREWLHLVAENCYKPDGYLIMEHFELLCRTFFFTESPDLFCKATRHFQDKFQECENKSECRKLKVEHIWYALMHVINLCRVNDEIYGTNDLETVIKAWSSIFPFTYRYACFDKILDLEYTDENAKKQPNEHTRGEGDDKNGNQFPSEVPSFSIVVNPDEVDARISRKALLEMYKPFTTGANSDDEGPFNNVPFSRSLYTACLQMKPVTTGSDNRNCAYRPAVRTGPNNPIKSVIEKRPENACGVLPRTYFAIMRAVAEELVSKGEAVDVWHPPLAGLIERNGLPSHLGSYDKWRILASCVRGIVKRERKIEVYCQWLMSIMEVCIDMDGNECGTHCKKVMNELLDLKPSLPESKRNSPSPNVRLSNRNVNDGARFGQPSRKAFAMWSSDANESGVQKEDGEASKSVDNSTEGTLLETATPFTYSVFGNRVHEFQSKLTPRTEETESTSTETRKVTATPVNSERNTRQSSEQRPDKGLAKADVEADCESDKTSKPEQKRGKQDDRECILSDTVATNTDGGNPRVLINMGPRGSQNPKIKRDPRLAVRVLQR